VRRSGYPFELHRSDIRERDPVFVRGVGDRLRDEHLARSRIVGDPGRLVDGLAVVVALADQDRTRVQAYVCRRRRSSNPAPISTRAPAPIQGAAPVAGSEPPPEAGLPGVVVGVLVLPRSPTIVVHTVRP